MELYQGVRELLSLRHHFMSDSVMHSQCAFGEENGADTASFFEAYKRCN